MPFRSSSVRRRFAWLMLLVGAFRARGLAPDGWMPVAPPARAGYTLGIGVDNVTNDRYSCSTPSRSARSTPT